MCLVRHPPDSVHGDLNLFLPNGVMTSSIVVGGILLASYQLFWMEQLSVCSNSDLVHHSRFQIHKHSSRNMFTGSSLREESTEGIISNIGILLGNCSIWMDSVLQAVQLPLMKRTNEFIWMSYKIFPCLPTGIAHLNPSLTNVNGNHLSHFDICFLHSIQLKSNAKCGSDLTVCSEDWPVLL